MLSKAALNIVILKYNTVSIKPTYIFMGEILQVQMLRVEVKVVTYLTLMVR